MMLAFVIIFIFIYLEKNYFKFRLHWHHTLHRIIYFTKIFETVQLGTELNQLCVKEILGTNVLQIITLFFIVS